MPQERNFTEDVKEFNERFYHSIKRQKLQKKIEYFYLPYLQEEGDKDPNNKQHIDYYWQRLPRGTTWNSNSRSPSTSGTKTWDYFGTKFGCSTSCCPPKKWSRRESCPRIKSLWWRVIKKKTNKFPTEFWTNSRAEWSATPDPIVAMWVVRILQSLRKD